MKVKILDDFDLYKIAYSGQCFRVKEVLNSDKAGAYQFITGEHLLYICPVTGDDNVYSVSCSENEWADIWYDYFDLNTSYEEIRESIPTSDAFLTKAAQIGKGIRILKQDKFEMLISFIISQRKSIPAIKSSVEKLCKLYGAPITPSSGVNDASVIYTFPTYEQLIKASDTELGECGLGYRVPYIIDAVKRVNTRNLDLTSLDNLSDDDLLEALKSVYGVGDKVANCVALFAYHRIGLSPIDTWIKKVIETEYKGNDPFGQYPKTAGIMQQYMFFASQHEKILSK